MVEMGKQVDDGPREKANSRRLSEFIVSFIAQLHLLLCHPLLLVQLHHILPPLESSLVTAKDGSINSANVQPPLISAP